VEKFELSKAKGTLKKCTTSKTKSKEGSKSVLTNDVHLLLVVDKRCEKAVDYLFPGYGAVENAIAARDGDHRGVKIGTKGETPELNVTVFDGSGAVEVWKFDRVSLHGKPELLINSLGDSHLALRIDAKLSKKDMSQLVDYIDADIYVSAEVAQPLLPGLEASPKAGDDKKADKKMNGTPVQQKLDGSMTGDELRSLRETGELSRPQLIDRLAVQGVAVSAKSLQRYEGGARDVPDEVATAVREMFA